MRGSATATGALWNDRHGALWNDRHGALRPDAPAASEPWSIDARGRWAFRLPGGRLLAWSGGFTRSARGYAFTIGGGIGSGGRVRVAGDGVSPGSRRIANLISCSACTAAHPPGTFNSDNLTKKTP
ncbi:hypothetical protein [Candidatus Palauibacter sp.]|uniref:hypothetical protein n=1 Tax=Candidatus Palauibacter sp. TaxID=3101350 RepID=UPI003B024B0E